MTLGVITLNVAVVALSCVIAYLFWTRIRVIRLQQEICDKRDELFDRAVKLNALDDPAYQFMRHCMNGLTQFIPDMSMPLMTYIISHDDGAERAIPVSSNAELQHYIDKVSVWTAMRLYRYIVRETATGWVVWFVFEVLLNPPFVRAEDTEDKVDKKVLTGVARVMRSDSVSRLADALNCAPA